MYVVGFEPKISAGKRRKTYALDRAATGTGLRIYVPTSCATEMYNSNNYIEKIYKLVQGVVIFSKLF